MRARLFLTMKSLAIRGALLALFGSLTVALGHLLGLDLEHVALLGAALGGVIGLTPDRSLAERIAGFGAGFGVAWVVYGLRASVLPDTASGRGVAVFLVLIVLTAITVITVGRVPLWSMLVGTAAMVGAYEETYTASPSLFLADSPIAATTILLAAALGVIGSMIVGDVTRPHAARIQSMDDRNDDAVVTHEQLSA